MIQIYTKYLITFLNCVFHLCVHSNVFIANDYACKSRNNSAIIIIIAIK